MTVLDRIYALEQAARNCDTLDERGYALTADARDEYLALCAEADVEPHPIVTQPRR